MNLFLLLNTKDVLKNVGNTVWVSLTSIVVVFSRRQKFIQV